MIRKICLGVVVLASIVLCASSSFANCGSCCGGSGSGTTDTTATASSDATAPATADTAATGTGTAAGAPVTK